jgi:Ca2+-binding EF-hand superfamily protein
MSKSLNNSKKFLNNDYNNFNYNSFKNNKSSYKVFTLKMMKDLIYDIYTSKTEFDKSCINNHVPLETLEQYLYTYLNVKYGLKPLIYENIQKILTGIKNFSSIDSEIFLFGKILRNEIEEDSKYFYEILRNNIINILTNFNKNLNSLKSYEEIKNIINQKITGKITYEECREILYKLFEYNDANLLEEKIIEYINQKKENYYNNDSDINIKINRNKLTREEIINNEIQKENKLNNEIDFNYVVKICHEFQIKIREKYLIKFKNVFDKVDIDNNGIINEQEFIVLIKQFGIFNEEEGEIERILNDIDPYGNGKITFSQLIRYFSNERYDKNNSILDKICLDNNKI